MADPQSELLNGAFEMPVEDLAVQIYLQRYPFAQGPDNQMNKRCGGAVRQYFAPRSHIAGLVVRGDSEALVRLLPGQTILSEEVLGRLESLMASAGISGPKVAAIIDDFGWEAKLIPSDAANVLVIGVGEGVELLFLRAVLPDARLTAVDYSDKMEPALKGAVGVHMLVGDMNEILKTLSEKFDLVSSNHTLEHLYTPDKMLETLFGMLSRSGVLLSTMPMDAMARSPFLEKVTKLGQSGKVHPADLVYLDGGHPWKTNPADLQTTFLRAGFGRVELYQRAEHLSRSIAGTEAQFHSQKEFGLKLHAALFGVPRALLRLMFRAPPSVFLKVLLAGERRVWFGANRLKNDYTQEVCVVASKPGR